MARKIITEDLKNKIIEDYINYPTTITQMSEKYNLCRPTIAKILKDIPKYNKALIFSPELDENYFANIDADAKAYFLGLLISDGNVFVHKIASKQALVSISLNSPDGYLLERFKQELHSNVKVKTDGTCNQFAVSSNKLAADLATYGVVPRKSYCTYLPNIDNKYMGALIRGILDGDGSVLAKQTDKKNRFLHSVSFCGSKQLMEDISEYLYNELLLKIRPCVYTYKDRVLSECKIQNIADIKIFYDWVYKDAEIFMTRKKDKLDFMLQHYFGHGNTEITD